MVRYRGRGAIGAAAGMVAMVLLAACRPDSAAPRTDLRDPGPTTAGCPAPALAEPPARRPSYSIDLTIAPERDLVTGSLEVDFTPDLRTDSLVFRLWPNGPLQASEGARLVVSGVHLDGERAPTRLPDPTTLVVRAPGGIEASESVTASLDFSLSLPGPVLDRISRNGSSVRLGSFIPLLPWVPGRGWATDPPTRSLAEASTSPSADFAVTIDAPDGLQVLATGQRDGDMWRAEAVRDFAVTAGDFVVRTAIANAPEPVAVTVAAERSLDADVGAFLQRTVRSLELLSDRYGPYPWPTFAAVVSPDLGRSGIEYPNLVYLGSDSLLRATTHEVGHQWFYSLVGNDQATDPWLDEGVTSWAQARGDDILEPFRGFDIPPDARDRLGAPMTYWDDHYESYFLGVYAQGMQALDALGSPREIDCALRSYVAANAYGIATPDDLLDALDDFFPDARSVLGGFGARF